MVVRYNCSYVRIRKRETLVGMATCNSKTDLVMRKMSSYDKVLLISFVLLIGCTSTNKKMETHPTTENTSELKALDKFWELLRPLRILNGARKQITECSAAW